MVNYLVIYAITLTIILVGYQEITEILEETIQYGLLYAIKN